MIEVRRMRATDEELQSLIANLMVSEYANNGVRIDKFTVLEMTYTCESPVRLRIKGQFKDGRQTTINLPTDLVIAAFVCFCTERGIPMRRNSVKSVIRVGGGVAFDMIVRNIDVVESPSLSEQVRNAFVPGSPIEFIRSGNVN